MSTKIIPLPEAEDYQIRSEKKDSKKTTLTRSQEEYLGFYKELKNLLEENIDSHLPDPRPSPYYQIPAGISGIHFEFAFHGRPRSSFCVELHFEKGNKKENLRYFNPLKEIKDQLETKLNAKLIFQEDWGKSWARIYVEKDEGKMTEELKTWAIEEMSKMYSLIFPKLEQMGKQK